MFYIIEIKYVGADHQDANYIDEDTIEIRTEPARTNSSGEVRIQGWCGTTSDWSVNAHGEYATFEEALAGVKDIFGDVRTKDANGDTFECDGEAVVCVLKPGKYIPMTREETGDFAAETIRKNVYSDTNDEQIARLAYEVENSANQEGYTTHKDLQLFFEEHRQELIDEESDDD